MGIVIGNAIAFIACILMVISGGIKDKGKTIFVQTIQIFLNAIACLFLKAYSGMIINLFSIPRNILAYKNKLTTKAKIILLSFIVTISVYVTIQKSIAQGFIEWIGFVPLVSTITYMLLMDKLEGEKFKFLVMFTMFVWIIHDWFVKDYVAVVFNIFNVITSTSAIIRIRRENKE